MQNNYIARLLINTLMKTCSLIFASCFGLTTFCLGQNIYVTKYPYEADVRVFITKYAHQADLLVYRVKFKSRISGNSGKWYFTKHPSRADVKIHFVHSVSSADLKVSYVKYKSKAGWKNISKRNLLHIVH